MSVRNLASVWSVRSRMDAAPAESPSSMRFINAFIVESSSVENKRNCASRSWRSACKEPSKEERRASKFSLVLRSAASSPSNRATRERKPWSPDAKPEPPSPHSSRKRRCKTDTSSSSHAILRSKPSCWRDIADDAPPTEVFKSLIAALPCFVLGPGAVAEDPVAGAAGEAIGAVPMVRQPLAVGLPKGFGAAGAPPGGRRAPAAEGGRAAA
mmetsp:Transcript_56127/g.157489  ORF Transcript_56127/g.157489 Transcript_56127/m.157489 type:complete len:212 (-) Transcript_56127:210-845(-)